MSRRRLSEEERALWTGVTRSVAPLRKRAASASAEDAEAPIEHAAAPKSRRQIAVKSAPAVPPPAAAPKSAPPPLAPLGRRMKKRVARGGRAIDRRLDLHGMTQAEAHDALLGFLRGTQAHGGRLVLVITGKGAGGDAHSGRGALRRLVPLWLGLPEFRSLVVGFESAAIRHGGEGALYVSLRSGRRS